MPASAVAHMGQQCAAGHDPAAEHDSFAREHQCQVGHELAEVVSDDAPGLMLGTERIELHAPALEYRRPAHHALQAVAMKRAHAGELLIALVPMHADVSHLGMHEPAQWAPRD